MRLSKKLRDLIPYYSYRIHWSDEDGAFVVSVDELEGCMAHGESVEQAMKNAHDAASLYLESVTARKLEVPEPISKIKASGDFLVRSNPELHRKLIIRSHQEGYKTLNKFIVDKLAKVVG